MADDSPKPPTRPGHNGGGALKDGNTVGVGRKASAVREKCAAGADAAVDWLKRVIAGEQVWPTVDRRGKRTLRKPTGGEMMEATERLLKYGVGTVRELTGKDGGPIEVAPGMTDTDRMLDLLSPEDLATMREIAARADAARDA